MGLTVLVPLLAEWLARDHDRQVARELWVCWTAVLLVLLLVGARYWRGRVVPAIGPGERTGGGLACVLILLLAGFYRFAGLEHYPRAVDWDAGLNAGMAMKLWATGRFIPVEPVHGAETLFFYLMAASMKWLGVSLFGLRFTGALVGWLTVGALFLFTRELLGRRVALLASLLCAISTWAVGASRVPKHALMVPLVICLTYYFLLRGLREGRWRDYLMAGFFIGASLHTFTSYRHGPLVAGMFVALYWLGQRGGDQPAAGLRGGIPCMVFGASVPVVPLYLHAAKHPPSDWWSVFREYSVFSDIAAQGSLLPLLTNVCKTLPHCVLLRISHDPGLGLFFGILVALCLPLLLRWRDPRFLALGLLALTMVAAPVLGRFHLVSARRYLALLPVLFPLIALAVLVLWDRLGPRLRPLFGLGVALFILVLGARSWSVVLATGDHDTHKQAVLRTALALADGVHGADRVIVYLPAGYAADRPELLFYFLHPDVRELPENDPFTIPDEGRDVMFIPDGTVLGQLVQESIQQTELHEFRSTDPRLVSLMAVWRLSHATFSALREQPTAPEGYIHVPQSGRYRVSGLRLGGEHKSGLVPLARGLMPYQRVPGRTPKIEGHPVTFWRRGGRFGRFLAAPVVPLAGGGFELRRHISVPLPRGGVSWARYPQDLALTDEAFYEAHIDQTVRILRETGRPDGRWKGLRTPEGIDLRFPFEDEPGPARVWSISAAGSGLLLVANSIDGWVAGFDDTGMRKVSYERPGGWREPVDVAVRRDGVVAVADMGRRDVVVFDTERRLVRTLHLRRPVSVAWRGDELLVLDAGLFELLCIGPDGEVRQSRFIGEVPLRSRVEVTSLGQLSVCRSGTSQSRLYGPRLGLLAPGGDPQIEPRIGLEAAAMVWEPSRSVLWVLDENGHLYEVLQQFDSLDAGHIEGIEMPASQMVAGNLSRSAQEFGEGMVVDGGQKPSYGVWQFEARGPGRYRCWALYATQDSRPVAVQLDDRTALRPVTRLTGGFTRRDARWTELGSLVLTRGVHRLSLKAEGLFPHLVMIKLIRQR